MAYVTYVKFYQPGFAIPSRLKTMSTLPYLAVLPSWRRALPLAAASLLALSLAGCNSDAADAVAAPPPTVSVAPVSVRKIVLWDEFNGRVEAVESVALRPRVSGYIDRVNYEEGQIVKRGDVLFEIDARSYRAALARAEADLARARTQAALARSEAARAQKLASLQAASTEELEQRHAAADQAQANVQFAQAAVETAKLDLSFTQVRSPITGRAGRALVTAGNLVSADGQASILTTVVSLNPVHVHFDVDERTYLRYAHMARNGERPDQRSESIPVQVGLVGENGYPHAGNVDFVDNRVDAATGTIRARATLVNPDGLLTPGLYARVRLPGSGSFEAMLIDDKAILTDQSRKYVYVIDENNTAQRRDITLGRKAEGLRIVEEGLNPGDRVIVNGIQKVSVGMPVTAQDIEMAPAGRQNAQASE
ncbi:TPA: efflux RND transporter periplasmic adaptor subunit [Pseudomonas aeruginosa]|uniref:Efflux RND transporter periplasmic adaptor subunit n=6 Tax=Pseudomonadota TaxID=1224 RepID=A0A9X3R2H1_ALCXX|nr:efflux RND transporter periplasmic adaptor subunit [Achromobacter xylosoxidans]MCZ8399829.1 efflux RND transporter periplasmic adaptor subunit [Achromobacter xylosoxidans]